MADSLSLADESPPDRWRRFVASGVAVWELRFRAAAWARSDGDSGGTETDLARILTIVRRCLFGEPVIPDEESLWNTAQAYSAVREARLHSSGAVIAAETALMCALRDVLAWRCVRLVGVDCEDAYVESLDQAFDGQVRSDIELKSQLLTSYHRVFGTLGGVPRAFKSRNSTRCRARPRRAQNKPKSVGVSADPEDTDPRWTKLARAWVRAQRRFRYLHVVIAFRQEQLDFLQADCVGGD